MNWDEFVTYFSDHESSPIVTPLLRQSKLIKEDLGKVTIACENIGAKYYLTDKKTLVEKRLSEFLKTEKELVLEIQKNKRKRKKEPNPTTSPTLMEYKQSREDVLIKSGIQERFTFENFAVSPTNQIAFTAAQAIADNPGTIYNPLFIYGNVGVGKTHLSHAVANAIVDKNPNSKVRYSTSEEFTNDLVENIREKNTKNLRDKYRKLDLLIIDDIQFVAGKNYVQEELYHTYNTLIQRGAQIILTSDRPPKEIKALEDRLKSRFSGGLMLDIQQPDFELRTAIVLIKAKERKIDIDIDAAKQVAEQITDSRELEGALLKLLSISLLQDESNKITAETTQKELQKEQQRVVSRATPQDIIKTTATFYDLKPSHLKSTSRKQNIALARQVAMYILRKSLELNYEEIAFLLKKKDHTTIMHGVDKITNKMLKDENFRKEIQSITTSILST